MKKCFLKWLANGLLNLNLQGFGAMAPFLDFLFITEGSVCVHVCVWESVYGSVCVCMHVCMWVCERLCVCVRERSWEGMRVVERGEAGCHHCPKAMIWDFHKGYSLEQLSSWDFLEGRSAAPALSHIFWCSLCERHQNVGTQELLGHECILQPLCSSNHS